MDEDNSICPYGTNCSIGNKCYCMNCIIPLENWIELGNYIYNKNTHYHDNDIDCEQSKNNNENNYQNNNDIFEQEINDNFIFNKSYILNKNTDLEFFINNIKSIEQTVFKYNIIYKNDEIIIYTINDKNFFLTNLLIYIDIDMKNILKINIISDIRSDFIKSNTINKLIN